MTTASLLPISSDGGAHAARTRLHGAAYCRHLTVVAEVIICMHAPRSQSNTITLVAAPMKSLPSHACRQATSPPTASSAFCRLVFAPSRACVTVDHISICVPALMKSVFFTSCMQHAESGRLSADRSTRAVTSRQFCSSSPPSLTLRRASRHAITCAYCEAAIRRARMSVRVVCVQ